MFVVRVLLPDAIDPMSVQTRGATLLVTQKELQSHHLAIRVPYAGVPRETHTVPTDGNSVRAFYSCI